MLYLGHTINYGSMKVIIYPKFVVMTSPNWGPYKGDTIDHW